MADMYEGYSGFPIVGSVGVVLVIRETENMLVVSVLRETASVPIVFVITKLVNMLALSL